MREKGNSKLERERKVETEGGKRRKGEEEKSYVVIASSYSAVGVNLTPQHVKRHANNQCYPPIGFSLASMPVSHVQGYKLKSSTTYACLHNAG